MYVHSRIRSTDDIAARLVAVIRIRIGYFCARRMGYGRRTLIQHSSTYLEAFLKPGFPTPRPILHPRLLPDGPGPDLLWWNNYCRHPEGFSVNRRIYVRDPHTQGMLLVRLCSRRSQRRCSRHI